jgi:hypothetical protein
MSERSFPLFYIWSPDYTYMHSGVRCLFLLCHHLNRLGYQAFITGRGAPSHLMVPFIGSDEIAKNRGAGIDDIVVYPEVVADNPLGGAKVVRYLLNRPGLMAKGVSMADYGRDDYFAHYAEEFRPAGVLSTLLIIPTIDLSIYFDTPQPRRRTGVLIYSVRYHPDLASIPKWATPYLVVSRQNQRDPETLAALYRESVALVTWERTAAVSEAIQCGCPVVVIPNPEFDHRPFLRTYHGFGVALGWNQGRLAWARRTIPIAKRLYRLRFVGLDQRIHRFARASSAYFSQRRSESAQNDGGHPL